MVAHSACTSTRNQGGIADDAKSRNSRSLCPSLEACDGPYCLPEGDARAAGIGEEGTAQMRSCEDIDLHGESVGIAKQSVKRVPDQPRMRHGMGDTLVAVPARQVLLARRCKLALPWTRRD